MLLKKILNYKKLTLPFFFKKSFTFFKLNVFKEVYKTKEKSEIFT